MYNYKQLLFSELLKVDGSVSIELRNIQCLVVETFRISRNLSPPI